MKVTWARGFFRVWMLFAVLWLIGGVAVGYGMIATPYVPTKSISMNNLGEATLYDTYGPQHRALLDAVEAGNAVASIVRPGYVLYTSKTLTAEQLTGFLEQGRSAVEYYVNRETSARRTSAIVTVLGWTLVPPLVLLALGWAIGWTLAGFRRPA